MNNITERKEREKPEESKKIEKIEKSEKSEKEESRKNLFLLFYRWPDLNVTIEVDSLILVVNDKDLVGGGRGNTPLFERSTRRRRYR